MTIQSTGAIMQQQGAVFGFNVIELFHAEAFLEAAETSQKGLVLQLSQNAVLYHGGLAPISKAVLELAAQCKVPVAVHLDHATDQALVWEAIDLGFSSLMFDGSTLIYQENLEKTREVVTKASRSGVWVEAELGEVGGKDGVHAPGVRTNPAEAKEFVEQTGVHGLAIAVGSSHAMKEKTATLDIELIAEINKFVEVPLVLHGSSGVSVEQIRLAMQAGIQKINLATEFNVVLTQAIRTELANDLSMVDPRKYLRVGKVKMMELAQSYLDLI